MEVKFDRLSSELVAAAERCWASIQSQHPEVPDAVVLLGSGVERGRLVKLGHWWGGRWEAKGETRGEVLLAGEALHLPVKDVFQVLLHEAAHGLNAARGVKDTSRGGRYHNARFKAAAVEVGLAVEAMPPHGWAKTSLTAAAAERYSADISGLSAAMTIARRIERSTVESGRGRAGRDLTREVGKGPGPAICGCGRKLRMAPSVLAQGPVICGICDVEFAVVSTAERAQATDINAPGHAATQEAAPGVAGTGQASGVWSVIRSSPHRSDLTVDDPQELLALNRLARSVRRTQGALQGRDRRVGELDLAIGDQVVVTEPGRDVGGDLLPPIGVIGSVLDISDRDRRLTVDFAIAGRYVIAAGVAGAALDYAYVTSSDLAREPLVDNQTSDLADVIELDFGR